MIKQQPRGFGLEDIIIQKFHLKGIKCNSWQEILDENSPKWTKFEWKMEELGFPSIALIQIMSSLDAINFSENLITCIINEGLITFQGEIIDPSCSISSAI